MLGLAGTRHRRSLILRKLFPSMAGMIDRSREIFNASVSDRWRDSYNEGLHRWRLLGGRQVAFGNVQHAKDREKYRGNAHDFYGVDEATEFAEDVVRFIIAWNRTSTPGQPCQVLLTFNPPTDEAGRWVIRFFLPWMAYLYPDLPECKAYTGTPAAPGELRWFTTDEAGQEIEVAEGTTGARSRTFFPAKVQDNPVLMDQGYDRTLGSLPEPLRSQLLYGDFAAGIEEDPWQIIPSAWVLAAQERWRTTARPRVPLSGLGVDVARGGRDQTVIASRYGAWYDALDAHPGSATPSGPAVAALIAGYALGDATVGIDIIGVGASVFDSLPDGIEAEAVNAGAGAPDGASDRSGRLTFGNMRAYLWWRTREALDPETGDDMCLPDDDQLRQELCSPRFFVRSGRIWVESKEDVIRRIGRSTDRADAVMLANLPESGVRVRWLG